MALEWITASISASMPCPTCGKTLDKVNVQEPLTCECGYVWEDTPQVAQISASIGGKGAIS
jgi:hypothetical protein